MEKLILVLRAMFGRPATVSAVLSDFHRKIKQLEKVTAYQKQKQAEKAKEIAKALKAQDLAQSEAHLAEETIHAIQSITQQPRQLTISELKKEIN